MSECADEIAYNRALYGKSEKHRLARINATRRRRGIAEVSSLADVKLRVPLSA